MVEKAFPSRLQLTGLSTVKEIGSYHEAIFKCDFSLRLQDGCPHVAS